jgi:hypothetical protein
MPTGGSADKMGVTFLIFLASLALLERVLQRDARRQTPPKRSEDAVQPADGLRQLGAALEGYGRGRQPESEETSPPVVRNESEKIIPTK